MRRSASKDVGKGGVRGLGAIKERTVAGGGGSRSRGHRVDAVSIISSRSQTFKSRSRSRGVLRRNLLACTKARTNLNAKTVAARRALRAQAAAAGAGAAGVAGGTNIRQRAGCGRGMQLRAGRQIARQGNIESFVARDIVQGCTG